MYGSVDNLIIGQHRELLKLTEDNFTYKELYSEISNPTLQTILSTLHYEFVKLFELMNERLPATEHSNNHYWADPSRELSAVFDIANSLVAGIKDSDDALEIDEYYLSLMKKLRPYLRSNGGSELPVGMEKVEVFYAIPIFRSMQSIKVTSPSLSQGYKLKLIGRGSYAQVFKYRDANYNRDIIVKRANSDLLQKELERFKIEFNQMKELHSPYIVEVYRYDDVHHEYTMECMDATLLDYINKNNNRLTITARIGITRQALRGFQYIHSKDLLHRDISPNNILVKEYEDVAVIKIADFGLVKIEGSTLTSTDTAFKGWFNDPKLRTIGFNNYSLVHEIYALTLIVFFILTGRRNPSEIKDPGLHAFVEKGTNPDESIRFSSVDELIDAFNELARDWERSHL